MENRHDTITINDVFLISDKYITRPEDQELIQKAYQYAKEKHEGQFRKSGDPYIVHLLNVAKILADLRTGPITISAGLLHDVIEDCDVTREEFEATFGGEILTLVEAVTKIGKLKFNDEQEYLASNHRKIFIAMASDVRVILIKLSDRLHNMRTLEYMKPEKQKRIAAETLDVYAPIAHRLGISEMKNELEDLSFRYLNKEKYKEIAKLVEEKKTERDSHVNKMIEDIKVMLDENHLDYRIFGRSKHLYSIYKKMTTKHKRFDEILDLLAIRIITKTKVECYEVLGYIHAKYTPIPGRFKDYIAMPKMNMYQSLHTTIVGDEGLIFEVQIRTEEMDEIAERGVAAHWKYKENVKFHKERQQKEIEEQLYWFKDFAKMSEDEDNDATSTMNIISKDIFEANVYVMSPKGRVIALPPGATPLDFAYRIHTDVGHQTVGATINGVLVPLNTALKNGDVVNIMTNKNSTPSEDWLKIVKSAHARQKIRAYFLKKEMKEKEEGANKGKLILENELFKRGYDPKEYMSKKHMERIVTQFKLHNEFDLYYALFCKAVTLQAVVEKLTNKKLNGSRGFDIKGFFSKDEGKKRVIHNDTGVNVAGIDTMKISLAPCCSPIPGDEIVGYVTKGQGVKIHRKDCPNVQKIKERLIDASWEEHLDNKDYIVTLMIHSGDRSFLLSDIVTASSQVKVGLKHVDSKVDEDGIHATTRLDVIVKDAEQLRQLISNIKKVRSVNSIERVTL